VVQPNRQLKQFQRVPLNAGEQKEIRFTITREDLFIINKEMKEVVEPGEFSLMIGPSSSSILLKGKLSVN
jgi:beta-glucosidase